MRRNVAAVKKRKRRDDTRPHDFFDGVLPSAFFSDALQSTSIDETGARPRTKSRMFLFILDSLGNSELLVILVAALIFFGPRKLPQLSRTIGKSLAEFRRASDDFKRTWAQEVALESDDGNMRPKSTVAPVAASFLSASVQRNAVQQAAEEAARRDSIPIEGPIPPASIDSPTAADLDETGSVPAQPLRKKDWL